MNIYNKIPTIAILFSVLSLVSGCGSDDSSSINNADPVAGIPANAIVITAQNANSTASTSTQSTQSSGLASDVLGKVASAAGGRQSFADFVHKIIQSGAVSTGNTSLVGVAVNEEMNCTGPDGGTITLNGSIDDVTLAFNGNIDFNNCSLPGMTVDGVWKIRETCNVDANNKDCTGKITSFSFSIVTLAGTIDYSNVTINYYDNYNDPWDYRESFTMEISSDLLSDTNLAGGVLIETTIEFQGFGDLEPESGQMVITGANGTKARITLINSTQYNLELDSGNGDGYVLQSGSPFFW